MNLNRSVANQSFGLWCVRICVHMCMGVSDYVGAVIAGFDQGVFQLD